MKCSICKKDSENIWQCALCGVPLCKTGDCSMGIHSDICNSCATDVMCDNEPEQREPTRDMLIDGGIL